VHSLREVITNLVSGLRREASRFPGSRGPRQTPDIEELARSVMGYGRIRLDARSKHGVVVEVEDLAFRLRETRRAVTEALVLLENQGRAERTKQNGRWRLQI
jgi:hypothetical protein